MASKFTLKDHFRESRLVNGRLLFSGLLSVIIFGIVIFRLVYLQVFEYEHFDSLSNRNRVDIEPLPPQRGLIYDRNGVLLAENIPTFSLEMVPEKVPDIDQTLKELSQLLALSEEDIDAFKDRMKRQRRFHHVVIRQRLTEEEVARFSANRYRFPGVDIEGRLIRHYPQNNLFAHAVGYVGRINERDMELIDQKDYKGTSQIGKTGIEKQYEDTLHGSVGYRQVETNVQGRIVRELMSVPSQSGDDLFLNLDINLQRVAADSLGDYNGSIVAIDPRNGGVLALVSKPDYNPNSFVSGISSKEYGELRDSPDRPLFDRALRGHYPPGSTLKPFVALAGLELGVVDEHSKTYCPGWYSLPGSSHRYRCWKSYGHGMVDMKDAVAQSCDVYFYDLAHTLGIDRLHNFLDYFGFGHRSGIDLPNESEGLSPSSEWKRASRNQAWFPGETLISGIGQGFNQTTPVQLAHATATLAMRGISMQPQVVRATRPAGQTDMNLRNSEIMNNLPMQNSQNWENVVQAMVEVIHGARGTARSVGKDMPFKVAGKTGTAQVFGIAQDEEYDAETLERKLHDHALFIAFAPADKPEFAVAVVVENGGSGSKVAAPIARKLIQQYFGLKVDE
ncbi:MULTISPECIES: penicillin-binding protein 2 [Methylophaga]|uniref:Peptidoglycan D,D-transpeptidase MrdA n=1 Tax=Methylophaga aminisulfidivorans MP TaxID=1026882 RepID=F5T2Q0_9GAMM|nr:MULTISPECIES: penicillin-binding protein 2 [Methylophaga]EGL53268.1 cell division protein FtsI/penicillin-binding protein 2 [Methylophaga aminisulfidivorans MP]WVI84684.1 penicillin-binding protein 2 [Methylophaga thalassica]